MTAKQYLRQLARLQLQISILSEEIETRRTRLTSTAAPALGDKVQSSPHDVFADMMAALADKEVQQAELLFIYEEQRDKIVREILGMDNPTQAEVLYLRYVKGQRWDVIADAMHYNRQHVCRIHGNALVEFAKKYLEP